MEKIYDTKHTNVPERIVADKNAMLMNVEVRDSPARDIWFLHTVPQGPYQMGRVVGTSSSPSPSSGNSGRHSGQGTIFGVCPYGFGLR